MAYSAALRPFGFSQPTRITKTEKRVGTPIPSHDSDRLVSSYAGHRKSRSHRLSLSNSFVPQRSDMSQRTFPDEEDDIIQPTHHSRMHEKRRPTHLQLSRHVQHSSVVSPLTPTAIKKPTNLQLRTSPSELSTIRETFSEKQLQEQIKEIYSALRRVEDEREKVLSHMKAGRADQCRLERELEETRRENQRLTARLEEMLRSSKMKSPLSARSDDGWGCSMYEMDG